MLRTVIPQQAESSLEELLPRLKTMPGRMPFDEIGKRFVGRFSMSMLTDRAFRTYPDLMAMANWFRSAKLGELELRFKRSDASAASYSVPRGLVFHIAPANVDAIFAYSWLLSLLVGNANVIRISQKSLDGAKPLIELFNHLLQEQEFESLRAANLALNYDHDDQITGAISSICHLRVIWGGDETVRRIRAIPLNPLANELAFANRFSLGVFDSSAILAVRDEELSNLLLAFYNDTFWYGQQACSSPRALVWVGSPADCDSARRRFWPAFEAYISRRRPEDAASYAMDRTTTSYLYAAGHPGARLETLASAMPSRILVDTIDDADRDLHCGHALFVELCRDSLDRIVPLLRSADQTLVYYGFSRASLIELLPQIPPHCLDRIVPAGHALTFGAIWDGQDLLRCFSRQIDLVK